MKTDLISFRRSWLVRVTSLVLLQAFLFYNIGFASANEISPPKKDDIRSLSVGTLGVRKDTGAVKDRYAGPNQKIIIHIQDAHCNYEAQSNISKILEGFSKEYGINLVLVEGADGYIDTSWFKAFPDAEIRREVADYFMKKGEITGAEFLSITEDYPIKLYGAENRNLYLKNLEAFNTTFPVKNDIEKYLSGIKTVLKRLKGFIYSNKLKEFDNKVEEYKDKELTLSEYAKILNDSSKKSEINLKEYPDFSKLIYTLIYEDKIDFKVVDQERASLIDSLSENLPKDKLQDLVVKSFGFKTAKVSAAEYYEYLRKISEEGGISLAEKYPNLSNYVIYTKLYDKIDKENLFDELDSVKNAVKEHLFENEDQRNLSLLWDNIDILIGLANIKLSNKEYNYYKVHKKDFKLNVFTDLLSAKVKKYNLAYNIEEPSRLIEENVPKLEDFYEIAIKRDKALVDNTLKVMNEEKTDVAVLITGGFHTEGIKEILKGKEISYLVVCPNITKDADSPYIKVLTNQQTPFEELLVESATPTKEEKGFLAPYIISKLVSMEEKDIAKLKAGNLEDRAGNFKRGWVKRFAGQWALRARAEAKKHGIALNDRVLLNAFMLAFDEAAQKVKLGTRKKEHVKELIAEEFDILLTPKGRVKEALAPALAAPQFKGLNLGRDQFGVHAQEILATVAMRVLENGKLKLTPARAVRIINDFRIAYRKALEANPNVPRKEEDREKHMAFVTMQVIRHQPMFDILRSNISAFGVSGGDCAGLNTALWAYSTKLLDEDRLVLAIPHGLEGLTKGNIWEIGVPVDREYAERNKERPGIVTGSTRASLFKTVKTPEGERLTPLVIAIKNLTGFNPDNDPAIDLKLEKMLGTVKDTIVSMDVDARVLRAIRKFIKDNGGDRLVGGVLIIGGDDHAGEAYKLSKLLHGLIPVNAIFKSIDDDAKSRMVGSITAVRESRKRFWEGTAYRGVTVMEIMGRKHARLALEAGNRDLTPEELAELPEELQKKYHDLKDTIVILGPGELVNIEQALRRINEIYEEKGVVNILVSEGYEFWKHVVRGDPDRELEEAPLIAQLKAADKTKSIERRIEARKHADADAHGHKPVGGISEFIYRALINIKDLGIKRVEALSESEVDIVWTDLGYTPRGEVCPQYLPNGKLNPEFELARKAGELIAQQVLDGKTGMIPAFDELKNGQQGVLRNPADPGEMPVAVPISEALYREVADTTGGKKLVKDTEDVHDIYSREQLKEMGMVLAPKTEEEKKCGYAAYDVPKGQVKPSKWLVDHGFVKNNRWIRTFNYAVQIYRRIINSVATSGHAHKKASIITVPSFKTRSGEKSGRLAYEAARRNQDLKALHDYEAYPIETNGDSTIILTPEVPVSLQEVIDTIEAIYRRESEVNIILSEGFKVKADDEVLVRFLARDPNSLGVSRVKFTPTGRIAKDKDGYAIIENFADILRCLLLAEKKDIFKKSSDVRVNDTARIVDTKLPTEGSHSLAKLSPRMHYEAGVLLPCVVREAIVGRARTPGISHVRAKLDIGSAIADGVKSLNLPLGTAENKATRQAQEATINEMKERHNIATDGEFYARFSTFAPETGGRFVIFDDDIYAKWAMHFEGPRDVLCNPGTRGTWRTFAEQLNETPTADPETLYAQAVTRFYYLTRSEFEQLDSEGNLPTVARHEERHIRIAVGLERVPEGESEERYINSDPEYDIRPIYAQRGNIAHMEDILLTDARFGEEIREYVRMQRKIIRLLVRKQSATNEIARVATALEAFIVCTYNKVINIERMQGVLTRRPYDGYDVIIVASSTPGEVRSKGKVLERVCEGLETDVYSVLSPIGGQVIGQVVALEEARDRRLEGMHIDLREEMQANNKTIVVFHDAGMAGRFALLAQSLGARGRQALVGTFTDAESRRTDAELFTMGLINAMDFALTNNGGRTDTFWLSQIVASGISHARVIRTNAPYDKFVVPIDWSLPEEALLPLLYQFGTAIADGQGTIIGFHGNRGYGPVRKRKDGAGYEWNPENKKIREDLQRAPQAYFDFGSFSMSHTMMLALWEFWTQKIDEDNDGNPITEGGKPVYIIEKLRTKGEFNEKKWKRDIDPHFTKPLVFLLRAISDVNLGRRLRQILADPNIIPTPHELWNSSPLKRHVALRRAVTQIREAIDARYRIEMGEIDVKAKTIEEERALQEVTDVIEFYLLYRNNSDIFPETDVDEPRVVGPISLGEDPLWLTYRTPIDVANEKLLMLTNSKNGRLIQIGEDGEVGSERLTLDEEGSIAVDAQLVRRTKGIEANRVCDFWVNGKHIVLSIDQVSGGKPIVVEGVRIHNAIIQNGTILEPGSEIIDSVVDRSCGLIKARSSYVEGSTAPIIEAEGSIIYNVIDSIAVKAEKEIVADAYRPDIHDDRFMIVQEGQTRMRAPITYDPKPSKETLAAQRPEDRKYDEVCFDDNRYAFGEKDINTDEVGIRGMVCDRSKDKAIENRIRIHIMVTHRMRKALDEHIRFMACEQELTPEFITELFEAMHAPQSNPQTRAEMLYLCKVLHEQGDDDVKALARKEREDLLEDNLGLGPVDRKIYCEDEFAPLRFGTSGLRALVTDMTDMECYINARGFIEFLIEIGDIKKGDEIAIAGDLRSSTDRITKAVARAIKDSNCEVEYCGNIPSQALAYYAMQTGKASIMVTGSHIPDDRNGIKFTKKSGEVLKSDEQAILTNVARTREAEYSRSWNETIFKRDGIFEAGEQPELGLLNTQAERMYVQRYLDVFPSDCLDGVTIVLYEHSTVGRDLMREIFEKLGATVIPIRRSDDFVPVDTEKISDQTRDILRHAAGEHKPFAIISADGDSDRPLFADENGEFLPGDKLGALASLYLKPTFVAIPVSTNDAVVTALREQGIKVVQTEIGSPYVIKAMNDELAQTPDARVASWEVNGGYLTGSNWEIGGQLLRALPTRDSVLPVLCSLLLAKQQGKSVSELIATNLPDIRTQANIIDNTTSGCETYTPDMGKGIVRALSPSNSEIAALNFAEGKIAYKNGTETTLEGDAANEALGIKGMLSRYFTSERGFGEIVAINFVDGIRIYFEDGNIAHIRPSGNAPELRMYSCANTQQRADEIVGLRVKIYPEIIRDYNQGHLVPASTQALPGTTPGRSAIRSGEPPSPGEHSIRSGSSDLGEATPLSALSRGHGATCNPYDKPKIWGGIVGEDGEIYGEHIWTSTVDGQESGLVVAGLGSVSLREAIEHDPDGMLGPKVVNAYGKDTTIVKTLIPSSKHRIGRLSAQIHEKKDEMWIVTKIDDSIPEHARHIIWGLNPEMVKRYKTRKAFLHYYEMALWRFTEHLRRINELLSLVGELEMELAEAGDTLNFLEEEKKREELGARRRVPFNLDTVLMILHEAERDRNRYYSFRPVAVGDVIVIPRGTPHALMPGITVLEPQVGGVDTWPLEDGSRYPVRYPIELIGQLTEEQLEDPGLDTEGAEVESIKGVPKTNIFEIMHVEGAYEPSQFRVLSEDEGVKVEEVGVFPKLTVHRIAMDEGRTHEDSTEDGYHILAVSKGKAKVITQAGDEIPLRVDEKLAFIPASCGAYKIVAEEDAHVIKMFSPVDETLRGIVPKSSDEGLPVKETKPTLQNTRRVVLTDQGTGYSEVEIVEDKPVEMDWLEGKDRATFVLKAGERASVVDESGGRTPLARGTPTTIPVTGKLYLEAKTGAKVEVHTPHARDQRAVFTTIEAVRRAIERGNISKDLVIDLFVDDRVYKRRGDKFTPGTLKYEEDYLKRTLGIDIKIRYYRGEAGLAFMNPRPGAVPIIIATARNLERASKHKDAKVRKFLASARKLPLPNDVSELKDKESWFFAREIECAAVLLSAVNPDAIREQQPIAQDLQMVMNQLTGRPVDVSNLRYLMALDEIQDMLTADEQKDPSIFYDRLIKYLLITMPMKRHGETTMRELNRIREVLMAA